MVCSSHGMVVLRAQAVTTADFPGGKVGDKPVSFRGRALDSSAEEPTPAMLFDQSMAFVDYTQVAWMPLRLGCGLQLASRVHTAIATWCTTH